ncbi:MAG TPA: CHAT domain-containing tetratricopeptide repeat protein, partial [Chitinophagaceae bacterium]|nr:CHAT domain-containing tetratricopeptide repeat protein [Chitinophagaceae bacterium]
RGEFDSTDVDYAVLVSDNAGAFNPQGGRELGGKFLTLKNVSTAVLRGNFELSDADNAKLNIEMGETGYAMGRYVYAERRYRAAMNYYEKGGMTGDPVYMKVLSNYGLLYSTMGRFTQAEKYTMQALGLRISRFGENDPGVAASFNNSAVLHYNLGQYNESEKDFQKAFAVLQFNKLESDLSSAIVLNNRAILYQALGRYDQAEKDMQKAMAIGETLSPTRKSGNRVKFFSNLALLYQQMGKYPEAENIYQKMDSRILDRAKPEYANMLNNLAVLYLLMNKPDSVEHLLQRSAAIFKTTLGENNPAYAKVISDLGNYYRYRGSYTDAQPLLEQALTIREAALGKHHPLYAQSQEDLAILFWKTKQVDKALPLYREVMSNSIDFINRYFPPMSEAEKTKYWDLLAPRFQRFFNFAVETSAGNKAILNELFEYRMATKGLLLHSTRKIREAIMNSGNEQLINDYLTWVDHKEELTRLYAFSKEDLQEQSVNLDSLESVANAMEKKLSENSKDFSSFYFTSITNFKSVRDLLKSNEALIEFIRIRYFDQSFNDSSYYAALVIIPGAPQPKLVLLKEGPALESKYSKTYRVSMKNKINDDQSYTHFWQPLEAELKGKKKIYVSLDGVYNQINLNTLKKGGTDYLINQYDFILLGNPRDLVIQKTANTANNTRMATLLGDPNYGSDKIPQLPATKTEVDSINKVLKLSGYQVNEFMENEATETNLKQSKSLSILHIATHGFFFPDVDKASWPIGVHSEYAKDNVLLRSGLMLSGAKVPDQLSPSLDSSNNGIITSYEAMNLDLKGTKLVVLSACETGLGEVRAGEGVYGLQRAFMVAGANALIMSLWKVDDVATQQLMTGFYYNWVKTGDMQKAFKQAQLQLMVKFKHPYYWGAFVIMED